jgi:glyoxylase-like metal-dependent hydrolase (beta-lactamase superfamily II)
MTERILDGVWWLSGTRGSNVFVVEAADGSLALVDTGFASSAEAILEQLAADFVGREIAAVLLTHSHTDHVGATAAIAAATGAKVIAGRDDCKSTPAGFQLRSRSGGGPIRRWLHAAPPTRIAVDIAVGERREVLPGISAFRTPGHTPGSLCFVSGPAQAAFVGDLVIVHGQELTRPLPATNADDGRYLASLAAFAASAPANGFPGHGNPVLGTFGESLRTLGSYPRRDVGFRGQLVRAGRLARFSFGLGRHRKQDASTPPEPSATLDS